MTTEKALAEVGAEPQALMITPSYIENTKRSLALLQTLIQDVLVKGRDYGSVPGTQEFLWDPGASTIISSFNCHPGERRILNFTDDGTKIALVVEVPIITNGSQIEVGSGIGAASTHETKHKYRWVTNPKEWGYSEGAIATLKTRGIEDKTQYRVLNPEHDELLNTIVKMASKRAEVDAAESLPGVASTLKDLFEGRRARPRETGEIDDRSPRWTAFWSQAKALLGELAEKQGVELTTLVHQWLGVESMKDWLKAGKTLDQAIKVLSDKLAKPLKASTSKKRDPASIKDLDSMFQACHEDFGLEENQVLAELNANYKNEIVDSPSECYIKIASVR